MMLGECLGVIAVGTSLVLGFEAAPTWGGSEPPAVQRQLVATDDSGADADDWADGSAAAQPSGQATDGPTPEGPDHKVKSGQKAKKNPQKTKNDKRGVYTSWGSHPSIRYGSVFRLDVRALFQEDAQTSHPKASGLSTYQLRQNRVGVSGSVFQKLEYEFERELTVEEVEAGKPPKSPWKDVFVNVGLLKRAQVQVGRFKVPFGLDELTPIGRNAFAIRSLGATHLAPARDTGAMVHGRFPERRVNYWAGVFAHDGDHARSSNIVGGDQSVAARVTGRPFRSLGIDRLEIGTAFMLTSLSNDSYEPNGLRGRTVVAEDTFFHAVYVNGHRRRWEADIDWAAGRATARAEYTWASDDRHQQGIGNDDLPDARAQSWYVSGGWMLVGEKKRSRQGWRSLTPSTLGSIEIVGRLERLWFDSAGTGGGESFRSPRAERISPSGERVLTLGVNWVITPHLRLQVNAIRERVEDVARSPVPNGAPFLSRVARLQFVL